VIDKLQAEYQATRYTSTADDWPPDQPKHFTTVALIHHQGVSSKQQVIGVINATLTRPGLKSFIKLEENNQKNYPTKISKTTKDISEIFTAAKRNATETILIEGAPGIGKTVLCKEIAYQWATRQLLQHKQLMFLFFLRNPDVQKVKSLLELFDHCCRNESISKALVHHLYKTQGDDLVILFDGYDEISKNVRERSLIADIIDRKILSKCTLVITSRPSAALLLHNNVSCRVEILGFTNSDRQKFIQESLKDNPERANILQSYLDNNTAINTFCYIPLVMTILLCLFKASIELPKTQTELYQKFICHTIIHFLKKAGINPLRSLKSVTDLEQPYLSIIMELSKVSFSLLEDDKIVFTVDDAKQISPKLNISSEHCTQLGLLKETKYFSADETNPVLSYNFLHLSIQEFFAAMYVSTLNFFQQKEILRRTFWNSRYFNMWIMYMGLTSGNKNAFKYFLSKSFLFSSIVSKRTVIPRRILFDKVKCLHLFQCFMEAKRDDICTEIGKDFKDIIIDLNNQTLLPKDVSILCFYLLRSNKTEWNKLVLSRCNIGDTGCSVLHKSLIVGDKNYLFFQYLDLSNNALTVHSISAIVDLVKSFKVVELNVASNPFHNAMLEFLGEFKHLKSITTGSINYTDERTVAVIIKTINKSMLHCVSIADNENSCLIFKKGDFRILSFPSSRFLNYQNFIMRDCKTTATTYHDLCKFLEAQENLTYLCICNNKFKEPTILSICDTLTDICFVQLHSVMISESDLSSFAVNKIATGLSSIPNCSIMVYSEKELKCINASLAQIIEVLEDHLTLSKLDISNCKDEGSLSLSDGKPLKNSIEVLKVYESSANSLAYLVKVLSFAIAQVICLNRTDIRDDSANEMASTLLHNQLLIEFDVSDSQLTNEAAITIMEALQNVTTLKSFKIHNCGMMDTITDSMAVIFKNNCATLTELDISNNKLCLASPIKALKNTCNLLIFKINSNKFTDEVSPDVADVLGNNPYIVEVDVTFNHFSPIAGKKFISALKDVRSINVFNIGNGIVCENTVAEVTLFIQNNTGLKELDLSENHLTAAETYAIVEALKDINSLQVFKSSKHMITKETVSKMTTFLSNNLALTVVDISSSLLTTGAVKLIRSFKHKPLQVLRMSNCRITQSETEEIADVIKSTALIELDLSDNQLAVIGVIIISRALKGLGSLQVLNLQNCGITGKAIDTFTSALSTLTNLSELDISGNSFAHNSVMKIMKALENSALNVFKMNKSSIIWPGEISSIVNEPTQSCKSLLHLELSNSNFPVTDYLQNVTTLKFLNISRCTGINNDNAKELSTLISKNSNLVSLDISHNEFGAMQVAKALQSVTTLQTFILSNCEITDKAAKHIATAVSCNPQLTELNISWNKLSGVGTNKIVQSLKNCNQLQILKLSACGITSEETEAIANILSDKNNLKELDISWNGLKADGIIAIMKAISNISSLQVFKIDNCDITDKSAETIANTLTTFYTLMELTICHNDFSPCGVATLINSLQSTSTIKVLKASNCLFDSSSEDIAYAIGNSCGLVHLEMYHSHFTMCGARLLSRSFTNVHILQHLKLINCSITEEVAGEIAAILAHNKTIEHLDLSHNPLAAGVIEIVRILQYNQILQVFTLQSCGITDESAFDLATFAKSTSLVEFDMLQNSLTDRGAFIIAKGFMDSLSLKVLKIRDWYKIFQEGDYEDDNYILDILRGKNVSLHLE